MSIKHAEATIEIRPNANSRATRRREVDGAIALEGDIDQEAGEYVLDVNSKTELEEASTALANGDAETLEKYLKPKED